VKRFPIDKKERKKKKSKTNCSEQPKKKYYKREINKTHLPFEALTANFTLNKNIGRMRHLEEIF